MTWQQTLTKRAKNEILFKDTQGFNDTWASLKLDLPIPPGKDLEPAVSMTRVPSEEQYLLYQKVQAKRDKGKLKMIRRTQ